MYNLLFKYKLFSFILILKTDELVKNSYQLRVVIDFAKICDENIFFIFAILQKKQEQLLTSSQRL